MEGIKVDVTDLIASVASVLKAQGLAKGSPGRKGKEKKPEVKVEPEAPKRVLPRGRVTKVTLHKLTQVCKCCEAEFTSFSQDVLTTFQFTNGLVQHVSGHFARFNPEHPREILERREYIEACADCFSRGLGLNFTRTVDAYLAEEVEILTTLIEREVAVERVELN